MISPQDISNDLRRLLPSAQAAWLYGSVARGEAGQSSDIDVAVLFDAKHRSDAWQLSQDASVLAALWGKPVDLINMRTAPCLLQKEIIQAQQRLFADNVALADDYELFALSQYRDHHQRYALDFARIANSGIVMERSHD
jgi:uncharacterized protein